MDVEFFKRIGDPAEARETAKRIYSTYIMPTASKEILLNPLLKHQLVRRMLRESDIKADLFNEAQDAVGEVLAVRCQANEQVTKKLGTYYYTISLSFYLFRHYLISE